MIEDTSRTLFWQSISLLENDRFEDYGDPELMARRIARAWSAIAYPYEFSPHEVALMLAAMKLIRESHSHKRDNLIDAAAYIAIADYLETDFTS